MQHTIPIMIIAVLIPGLTTAQDQNKYQCTMGDLNRRVEIVAEPGVSVPCEVHYYKDSEAPGEQQVLWRAMNEEGYCEAKARAFIASLGEMGWNCGQAAAAEPADQTSEQPPPSDDTADLAPAEDVEPGEPQ